MRRLLSSIASAVLLAAHAARPVAAQSTSAIRPLPFTRFVLPNGLTVILSEDHATPIVALHVAYRIGFRDDSRLAGIAHFCEHISTDGSTNVAEPINTFYRPIGGVSTHWAATNEDVTNIFMTVPGNELETALWAEADRMAHPLVFADSQHVASDRSVLARERAQERDNIPAGTARDIVYLTMYPESHPYRMAGVTPLPDLPKVGAADVTRECAPAYVPNNAVLALSGDFSTAAAKKMVEKYFAAIPRGRAFERASVPAVALPAERRVVLEDSRIAVPQLRIVWFGASYADPDRMGLLALASTLSLSRFGVDPRFANIGVEPPTTLGRLSRVLVNERQLATRVIVENYDLEHSGQLEMAIFPRPNTSLTTIETVVDSVLADLSVKPVTQEEIALFNSYNDVFMQASLQPHFMRADTLAHDEIYAKDPVAYAKQAVAAHKLTPADLDRIRKRFLVPGRVVLSIVPAGKLDLVSKPDLPYVNATAPKAVKP
jgi:zinc protease